MVRNQLPSSEQKFNGLSARGSGNVHDAPQDHNVRAARYVPTSAVMKPRTGFRFFDLQTRFSPSEQSSLSETGELFSALFSK